MERAGLHRWVQQAAFPRRSPGHRLRAGAVPARPRAEIRARLAPRDPTCIAHIPVHYLFSGDKFVQAKALTIRDPTRQTSRQRVHRAAEIPKRPFMFF